jgi:tetratricopeptide (TPR) repeat protein
MLSRRCVAVLLILFSSAVTFASDYALRLCIQLPPSVSPRVRHRAFAPLQERLRTADCATDGHRVANTADLPDQGVQYAELVSSGHEAAARRQFTEAVDRFRGALAISDADGAVYVSLGHALFALKKYPEAATAYEKARSQGFYEAASGAYRVAVCHALAGHDAEAIRWLQEALRSRLKSRAQIAQDERLVSLRQHPLFHELIGGLPPHIGSREQGWRYDLQFLTSEIQRLHPVYSSGVPETYRQRLAALHRRLDSLTDQQIAVEIMALFASLGDAHSVMFPFGMKKGVLSRLPVQLYAFSDGMFIIDAPPSMEELVATRVVEIGGKDVGALGDALQPYLSRDNDAFLSFELPIALTFPDLLVTAGAAVQDGPVPFKLLHDQRTFIAEVTPLQGPLDPEKLPLKLIAPKKSAAGPPDYLAHLHKNFWLRSLGHDLLYVQINQCRDQSTKTLDQFAGEMDEAIATQKPRNLVVDVRLNNGGDYESMFGVAKCILRFEKSRPDARLFVIIGRNTLSAAQNFISLLDVMGNPIFVGEPSGSRPNHTGDDTEVTLPYSGISGSIACALHQTNFRDKRVWIAPRIPVALSSHAYFGQQDPALEAIKRFITRN